MRITSPVNILLAMSSTCMENWSLKAVLPAAISAYQVWFTDYEKTGSLFYVGS
jgi:hypothetical protein